MSRSALGQLALQLRRGVRLWLTAVAFAGFIIGAVFLSWVAVPLLQLRRRDPATLRRACQHLVQQGFRTFHAYLAWARLLQIHTLTIPADSIPRPCVIIANHPTMVDATAILASFEDTVCVVKRPLFQGWAIGRLLRACWYIDNDARGGLSGGLVLPAAQARLSQGTSVLIFPEGTRSLAGLGLRRFKRGAFEIAMRAQVPIVPILLYCDPPILAKEDAWYRVPLRVPELHLQLLPALDPQDWPGGSRAMAAHVQQMFQERLEARATST